MAGIFIKMWSQESVPVTEIDKKKVLDALTLHQSQQFSTFSSERMFICVTAKLNQSVEDVYLYDESRKLVIALDGHCRVSEKHHANMTTQLDPVSQASHLNGIAELVSNYELDWHNMIEGSYNLAVYDTVTKKLLLCNDIFGFYPFYCYDSPEAKIFASKLEAIISGISKNKLEIDFVSIAEHLLFNYIITDNSYIKGVHTLPDASLMTISDTQISLRRYWRINEYLHRHRLSESASFELFDYSLKNACLKIMEKCEGNINMSLTGGWDSRLVLSYYMKSFKNRLKLYSFGAIHAPDIVVPQQIANSENLNYSALILDDNYLENEFKNAAHTTVIKSDGTRNFKRSHYVNAIGSISDNSINLITGIFGDQVIKVGKPAGSTVLSSLILYLIEHEFKLDNNVISRLESVNNVVSESFKVESKEIKNELVERVEDVCREYRQHRSKSEQLFLFQFTKNLRKYFGNEAASYSDYVHCHTPFIDKQFISDYLTTSFAGFRHPFISYNIIAKMKSTRLYAKLIKKNSQTLLKYPSARGYSMNDALSHYKYFTILLKKRYKKVTANAFHTEATRPLFVELARSSGLELKSVIKYPEYDDDLLSIAYWVHYINNKYR